MSSPLANSSDNITILNSFENLNNTTVDQSISNFRNNLSNINNINTNLTNSMMSLSLSNGLQQQQQLYKIKLKNLPNDITLREAYAIFALTNDLIDLEIINENISPLNAINESIASSNDSQQQLTQQQQVPPQQQQQVPPQQQQQVVPVIYATFKSSMSAHSISSFLNYRQIFGPNTFQITAEIDDGNFNLNHSNLQSPTTNPSLNGIPNGIPNGNNSSQDFNKRPSIVTQKSRFLFNDPFNAPPNTSNSPIILSTIPSLTPVPLPQQQQQQPIPQQQQQTSQQQQQDLMAGKSLLMMEAQNDAREYEQLVRWGSHPSIPSAAQQGSGSLTPTNPQQQQLLQQQQQLQYNASLSQQQQLSEWERRRTSSFYVSPLPPQLTQPPQQQQQQRPQLTHQTSNMMQQPPTTTSQLQLPQQQQQTSFTPSQQQQQPSTISDIPELSLLSRVPAPVNPADQNPPCNTLYVGNLPPDATELELRLLFAPQQGFRRLSFRTKLTPMNSLNSNHNHGPMCFVEFEDVSLATRALLELYGKLLPNRGLNGGKGIRLSFSKNPLGVRGPQRNVQQQQQQVTNNSVGVNVGLVTPISAVNNTKTSSNGQRYGFAS